jgi:hypothetical protein
MGPKWEGGRINNGGDGRWTRIVNDFQAIKKKSEGTKTIICVTAPIHTIIIINEHAIGGEMRNKHGRTEWNGMERVLIMGEC